MSSLLGARPRLHRVLAPAALLVVAIAILPAALVVLASCRQLPGALREPDARGRAQQALHVRGDPNHRPTSAFVSHADRPLALSSLDGPRLRSLSLGVKLAGDD
jgi:hypothetical protein